MSAVSSLPASPTCALVYSDDALVRRNRIVRKLERRGLVVKKEVQANSKRFDFATVDLVVVITDGVQAGSLNIIEADARLAGKAVVRLPHQESRGWDVLDRHLPAPPDSVRAPMIEDPIEAELYVIVEKERDDARAELESAKSDLRMARADRDAASTERETWIGRARRSEADLEAAKLGEREALTQAKTRETELAEARVRLRDVEDDLSAARGQNTKLVTERDAAREAIQRQDGAAERMRKLEIEITTLQAARDDLRKRLEDAKASVGIAARKTEELQAKLDAAPAAHLAKIKQLTEKLAAAERELATRSAPTVAPRGDVDNIAASLRTLSGAGIFTWNEAFEKLVEVARRG